MPTRDVVTLTHPTLTSSTYPCTRGQFERVWRDLGWTEAAAPRRKTSKPTTIPAATAPADSSKES